MDRTEFMDIVYDLLKDDPDNNRANSIIVAADEYAEDAAKEALIDKDTNVPSKEIIHCKDCKHYRAYAGRLDGYCHKAEWYNRYQNEDDFCSRGER